MSRWLGRAAAVMAGGSSPTPAPRVRASYLACRSPRASGSRRGAGGPRRHAERVGTQVPGRAARATIRSSADTPVAAQSASRPSRAYGPELRLPAGPRPPSVQITVSSRGERRPTDVFLTPTHGYGQSGPMIIDAHGRLVWFQPAPKGDVARTSRSRAIRASRCWSGGRATSPRSASGSATDVIYSSSYQPIASVAAGNGYWADLHDIQITPAGLRLHHGLLARLRRSLLASEDLATGRCWTRYLQEVDVKTGLVMFEWHAYAHVPLSDSYWQAPRSPDEPWDYFHINSVSLDPWGDGNFIVSSRNTWAAYEIDHTDRRGPRGGSGASTPPSGWGPARAPPGSTTSAGSPTARSRSSTTARLPREHSQSRVIRERIDWSHRTVTLAAATCTPRRCSPEARGTTRPAQRRTRSSAGAKSPTSPNSADRPDPVRRAPAPTRTVLPRLPLPLERARRRRPPALAVRSTCRARRTASELEWRDRRSRWRGPRGSERRRPLPIATAVQTGFETAIPVQSTDVYFAAQALGPAGEVLDTSRATHR